MDLPEYFGSWTGIRNRLRKWVADGTCEKILTALLAGGVTVAGIAGIGVVPDRLRDPVSGAVR
ncbi:transposase [Streptomyces seoulensis]|nr:transposase [Streptomyces seoulensis]